MNQLTTITANAKQSHRVVLDTGKIFTLYLEYSDLQTGWFADVTYGGWSVKKLRVTNAYNILRQFKNLIPFGICCRVTAGQEPLLVQDFSTGRAILYVLQSADIVAIEANIHAEV